MHSRFFIEGELRKETVGAKLSSFPWTQQVPKIKETDAIYKWIVTRLNAQNISVMKISVSSYGGLKLKFENKGLPEESSAEKRVLVSPPLRSFSPFLDLSPKKGLAESVEQTKLPII
ncbi:hypothetical protein NL676_005411 [Syzygium grande]|nr:hypothetical protein NL676_005411 [Syzygium grande]